MKLGTAFHDKGLPAEETTWTVNLIILVDSIYRRNKSYYSQVILEECKYVVKMKLVFLSSFLFHSLCYFQ